MQAMIVPFLIAIAVFGGGKGGTNDPPRNAGTGPARTIPSEDLPSWFVRLGYPATDSDGSGIPDCWERWTHTTGMPPDADPDGDGLAKLREFEAQTDPICADTDGDGLDDATELAGFAAGIPDLDPVIPATFSAYEPDADEDGIPDIWEDADVMLFDGIDMDGFPWNANIPEPATNNYDVMICVTSSRHAELSWGVDWGESLLLPPCTNLALRLRLSVDGVKTVSLSHSPNASVANPVGTWRAALVADWDERRNLQTEGNRLASADGTMVDRSERESVSIMAWMPPSALRSGTNSEPSRGGIRPGPSVDFTPRLLNVTHAGSFCPVHGSDVVFTVVAMNAAPPYLWTEDGIVTETQTPSYHPTGSHSVSVRWKDSFSRLFVSASGSATPVECRPGRTNFVGAGWTSTHNPTDATDHAPGVVVVDRHFGPFCPVAHDVDVKLGWTHDSSILNIRNLIRILSGDAAYDRADHCIGIEWREGKTIRLSDYLDSSTVSFYQLLRYRINGRDAGETAHMGSKPKPLYPKQFVVDLLLSGSEEPLDTFVIVLFAPEEKSDFSDWVSKYSTNTAWTALLPASPRIMPSSASAIWYAPGTPGSFMHHDAVHDMRSRPVSGGHGHQATYDTGGMLITNGTIACGTADYISPESILNGSKKRHRNEDVHPFLKALHLDGNPGHPDNMTGMLTEVVPSRLTVPCIHQGPTINSYISLRPSFPTGMAEP